MADWNLPDWKTSDLYPETEQRTKLEWWWEFTRRRPDYRELWTTASAKQDIRNGTVTSDDYRSLRKHFHLSRVLDPALDANHEDLWWRINRATGLHEEIASGGWDDFESFQHKDLFEQRNKRLEADQRHKIVTYRFDLSLPIGPQIKAAEIMLQEEQGHRVGAVPVPKTNRSKFPLYLRALDAREQGATYAEMTDVFWPDRRDADHGAVKRATSARDVYVAAVRLRDNFPI